MYSNIVYFVCPKYSQYHSFRWDMSKAMDYWETHDHRTIEDIKSCALKSAFSCQHQPLLDIKLENVVLDELHLMLRITGIIK